MALSALSKKGFLPTVSPGDNTWRLTSIRILIKDWRSTSACCIVYNHVVRKDRPRSGVIPGSMEVGLMTLKTEERFVLLEKIVGHRAVRVMADGAIFNHRIVLKDKGPLIAGVTGEAEVVQPLFSAEHSGDGVAGTMRVVAIGTAHVPFFYRVAGDKVHPGLNIPVTLAAKLKFILDKELGLRIMMDFMAVRAGNIIFGMF